MKKNILKNKIKGYPKILKISCCVFILTFFAQLYFSNSLAVKTSYLKDLTLQKSTLEKTLASLDFEDSSLSSLSFVEKKANELGFIKNDVALLRLDVAGAKTYALNFPR